MTLATTIGERKFAGEKFCLASESHLCLVPLNGHQCIYTCTKITKQLHRPKHKLPIIAKIPFF